MWAIINIANPRWDTPSSIDLCETEEEAEAFIKWLEENGYGGCSDWSFVKVKGRLWTELPKPLHWMTKYVKVTMLADGTFEEEVSDKKMTGDRFEQENEWNYSAEVVDAVAKDGFHVSMNEPKLDRWNKKGPYVSIWAYSDGSQPAHVVLAALDAKIRQAKELLAEQFKAEVKPVEPVAEEVVWTQT